jgi:3-oxoacyl-(acyl-carrier-protein) synthase
MSGRATFREPIVISGIGLVASTGLEREKVWQAVRTGRSNFHFLDDILGIPPGQFVGATVPIDEPLEGKLKVIALCELAAKEALNDAEIDLSAVDLSRFACAISGHMGDTGWIEEQAGHARPRHVPWWTQMFPNTACTSIAHRFQLGGPRLCHSTACASSLISVVTAARAIRDQQCDIALAGGGDAIHPIFVAGFNRMRVLAKDPDPSRACRPFDRNRKGFVFGEGSAIFVVERLSHARRRGAKIYAEIAATTTLAQAHHVTGIDAESDSLAYLIRRTLQQSGRSPEDIAYINAHGTGTEQNDLAESEGIRRAFGSAADKVCVSATKSVLGHMINAAGAAELAITALALRDGYAPPTLNLEDQDPACRIDCLPLVGRRQPIENALKLSLAFGGHLVAVLLSRWHGSDARASQLALTKAA